jgi:hypothetical protein
MLSHYCIIREDLDLGLKAAYLIHAAGESSTGTLPPNTRAVALAARDEEHLRVLEDLLKRAEVDHHAVWEDEQLFAIGIEPTADLDRLRKVTSNLPLVR